VWRGESFYNPRLTPLVEELIEKGVAEESDGAMVCIPQLLFCKRVALFVLHSGIRKAPCLG